MSLGKRSRPPFKRTTSMTRMTVDDLHQPDSELHPTVGREEVPAVTQMMMMNFSPSQSPRNLQTLSGRHLVETSHFLRTCGFCHRRLSPGRDIYMYRGDAGFCSLECREKQMKEDERFEQSAPATSDPMAPMKSHTLTYAS